MAVAAVLFLFQVVATFAAVRLQSETPYIRPYFSTPVVPLEQPQSPLAGHVVLIVFDGARYDVMTNETAAPNLAALAGEGVLFANHRTNFPSDSRPSYAVLGTGAYPYQTQVVSNGHVVLPATETIFEVVQSAGMTTAAVAFDWYEQLFGPWLDAYLPPNYSEGEAGETEALADNLYSLLREPQEFPNLTVVHFNAPDAAGHGHGGSSPQAHAAVSEVDAVVGEFVANVSSTPLLANDTAFFVTCDHGMTDSAGGSGEGWGGHGISAEVVLHVPLVVAGPGVRRGVTITGPTNHVDVAETVAYVLGTRVPKDSSGRVLFEAFETSQVANHPRQNAYWHHLVSRDLAQLERLQYSNARLPNDRFEMLVRNYVVDDDGKDVLLELEETSDIFLNSGDARRGQWLERLEGQLRFAYERVWTVGASDVGTRQFVPLLLLMATSVALALAVVRGEGKGVSLATFHLKSPGVIYSLVAAGGLLAVYLPVKVHAKAIVEAGIWPLVDPAPLVGALLNLALPLLGLFVFAMVWARGVEEKLRLFGVATLMANLVASVQGVGYQVYHLGLVTATNPFNDLVAVTMAYAYLPGITTLALYLLAFVPGKTYLRLKARRASPAE
ncbi:MAG: hypothetical protein Kow0069_19650 [Promethearchaeota archaeon]